MRRHVLSMAATAVGVGLFAGLLVAGCGGGDSGSKSSGGGSSATLQQLLPDAQRGASLVGSDKCGQCHNTPAPGSNAPTIYATWHDTKHASIGVGCENCHGPGSVHAAHPATTNILTFPNSISPLVCGQCHTSHTSNTQTQFDAWTQSPHREMVPDVLTEGIATPGTYVRTCWRCHNAQFKAQVVERGINPTNMSVADLTTYATYIDGQNKAGDPIMQVATSNCVVCHDPHAKTGNSTGDDGTDFQVRRSTSVAPGSAETTKITTAPGGTANPDLYTTINHVCAQCHNARGADPSDAGLLKNTSRPGMHDSPQFNMLVGMSGWEDPANPPVKRFTAHAGAPDQCVTCHMADGASQHAFTVKLDACAPCHSVSDAAARRTATQDDITNQLASLQTRLNRWSTMSGMPWGYSSDTGGLAGGAATTPPAAPTQGNIPLAIKRARNNYWFVIRDLSNGVHNAAYTRYLLSVANTQLDTLNVPRAAVTLTRSAAQSFRAAEKQHNPAEYQGINP